MKEAKVHKLKMIWLFMISQVNMGPWKWHKTNFHQQICPVSFAGSFQRYKIPLTLLRFFLLNLPFHFWYKIMIPLDTTFPIYTFDNNILYERFPCIKWRLTVTLKGIMCFDKFWFWLDTFLFCLLFCFFKLLQYELWTKTAFFRMSWISVILCFPLMCC